MVTPAGNTASSIVTLANRNAGDNAGFVPAGLGGVGYDDRPLTYALDDAQGGGDRGDDGGHAGQPYAAATRSSC